MKPIDSPKILRALILVLAASFLAGGSASAQLAYTLNPKGLATLTYAGTSFLGLPNSGQFGNDYSCGATLERPDHTTYKGVAVATSHSLTGNVVTATFPWGVLKCAYSQSGDRLVQGISVENTTPDTITSLILNTASKLVFPATIKVYTGDPGMFYGRCGPNPLTYPHYAPVEEAAPIIRLDYGTGIFDFVGDDVSPTGDFSIAVPNSEDGNTGKMPRLAAVLNHPLPPGETATTKISCRFGAEGTPWTAMDRDVLDRYNGQFPFQLNWSDHRVIGYDILSSAGKHPAGNPRGYFNNATDVDVTTEAGKAAFRVKLMVRADSIIAVLKRCNAQGFICWNIEGAEDQNVTYYGDPAYVDNIPEMNYVDASGIKTCDAYFKKISDAGFKIGHCLRPQELTVVDGTLMHVDSPDPGQTLIKKINYAKKRWGSTLFYVDSTTFENAPRGNVNSFTKGPGGSLFARYFKAVMEACPDSLTMPENQYGQYYAYTAPFDSYFHHSVKETPVEVRDEWPGSFSSLMFNGIKSPADVPELVNGVRQGDILVIPCWYDNKAVADAIAIYQQAGTLPKVAMAEPANGTTVAAQGIVRLVAKAAAAAGSTLAKVEFFRNDPIGGRAKIGEAATPPYAVEWNGIAPGDYSVTAVAIDSAGLVQYSAATKVTAKGAAGAQMPAAQ